MQARSTIKTLQRPRGNVLHGSQRLIRHHGCSGGTLGYSGVLTDLLLLHHRLFLLRMLCKQLRASRCLGRVLSGVPYVLDHPPAAASVEYSQYPMSLTTPQPLPR